MNEYFNILIFYDRPSTYCEKLILALVIVLSFWSLRENNLFIYMIFVSNEFRVYSIGNQSTAGFECVRVTIQFGIDSRSQFNEQ